MPASITAAKRLVVLTTAMAVVARKASRAKSTKSPSYSSPSPGAGLGAKPGIRAVGGRSRSSAQNGSSPPARAARARA